MSSNPLDVASSNMSYNFRGNGVVLEHSDSDEDEDSEDKELVGFVMVQLLQYCYYDEDDLT